MSTQSARNPTELGLPPSTQSSQVKNLRDKDRNDGTPAHSILPRSESPELLRWRADMLMDEMMLGAVDVYAGEPKVAPLPAVPPLYQPLNGQHTQSPYENAHNSAPHEQETYSANSQNGYGATSHAENAGPDEQTYRPMATAPSPFSSAEANSTRKANQAGQSRPAAPVEPPVRETKSWVFSAEARYQQLARSQQTESSQPDVNLSSVNFTSSIPVPAPAQPWMATDSHSSSANPVNGGLAQTQNGYVASNGSHAPELGPVRRTVAAQMTSAMAMPANSGPTPAIGSTTYHGTTTQGGPNRNGKWSNLLPRVSNTDLQTLHQEITTLHSEINAILPPNHESNQHAQHLLEKARAILENDSMRSAEVEYYLQQVRTIFQRVQQTIGWSNLYRNRLLVYLGSWSLLATIVMLARYLYQSQMESLIIGLTNWATDSFAAQNFAAWLSTLFAGALGGAIGTLINLRVRSRLEHGFFDRKYGLRGLILPVMGALFGCVLYLFAGLVFYLLDVNPSVNVTLSTLPPVIAFVFGISQEAIYGTRS